MPVIPVRCTPAFLIWVNYECSYHNWSYPVCAYVLNRLEKRMDVETNYCRNTVLLGTCSASVASYRRLKINRFFTWEVTSCMEIVITLICITLLVISVGNLIGLKAKVTALVTVIVDIFAIVVIVLTVDITPIIDSVLSWSQRLANSFVKEISNG